MNCNGSYWDGIIGARTEISIACIQRGVKNTSKIEFSRVFVLPQDMKSCKCQRAQQKVFYLLLAATPLEASRGT